MNKKRDYSEEVLESGFAWNILRKIWLEEANYTKEIADQLDSKPQSVSNYLKGLREVGLVRKGDKIGRSQLYEANTDAFYDIWVKIWSSRLEVSEEELIPLFEDYYLQDVGNELKMNIKPFIVSYALYNLGNYEQASIREVLTDLLEENIWDSMMNSYDEVPDWLKNLAYSMRLVFDYSNSPKVPVEKPLASMNESERKIKEDIEEEFNLD